MIMANEILYTNLFGNQVTNQQLQHLDSYREVKFIDGTKKEEKVYESNQLDYVLYYSNNETINEIINLYPNNKVFIFHSNEVINGYLKRNIDEYINGILYSKSIQVENSNGEIVFESEIDINTGVYTESKKYKYFDEIGENGEREWQYVFNYKDNVLTSIDVFINNDEWDNYKHIRANDVSFNAEYFSWDGLEQYQTIDPIIPQ